MGKGWAKGLTKVGDARVAHAAAAHLGMKYIRRTPRPLWKGNAMVKPYVWTPTLAYVVGLTATDGCLIDDGRHINFKSADEALVATFLQCLERSNRIQRQATKKGSAFYTQFSDVALYRWLQSVGLTPRKSLTLGPLTVPSELVLPLARGLLDGDGSVSLFEYAGTGKAKGRRYQALRAQFNSASRPHIDWLRDEVRRALGISGCVTYIPSKLGAGCWRLSYGNRESERILTELYRDRSAPCLLRKRDNWDRWLALNNAAAPRLGSGSAR